jgi:hypothetical protein
MQFPAPAFLSFISQSRIRLADQALPATLFVRRQLPSGSYSFSRPEAPSVAHGTIVPY